MPACACLGPPGNCPCLRVSRGQPVPITETFLSPELFSLYLTDEEKTVINDLKLKALQRFLFPNGDTPS